MSIKDLLEQNPDLPINKIQEIQKEYDRMFVDDSFSGFDKVRHTYAHMGKLFGRLAEYIQMTEDGTPISADEVREKVIPDLIIYSCWLANELGVDIGRVYLKRMISNIRRLHSDRMDPKELEDLERYIRER